MWNGIRDAHLFVEEAKVDKNDVIELLEQSKTVFNLVRTNIIMLVIFNLQLF